MSHQSRGEPCASGSAWRKTVRPARWPSLFPFRDMAAYFTTLHLDGMASAIA